MLYKVKIQVRNTETAVYDLTWDDLKGGYRFGAPNATWEVTLK